MKEHALSYAHYSTIPPPNNRYSPYCILVDMGACTGIVSLGYVYLGSGLPDGYGALC